MLDFAKDVLAEGGVFICKVLQGGATGELLKLLKRDFAEVKHVKPPASRRCSARVCRTRAQWAEYREGIRAKVTRIQLTGEAPGE